MDKQTAINKIRKCLALAKSSEPHEAAAALRQAQKLAEQFCVDHPELLAAGVTEDWSKSSAMKVPPQFEVNLASAVAGAFGCELLFSRRLNGRETNIVGGYMFIGVAPSPEIAAYTFSVLGRQLRKARTAYIKTHLKRHTKTKTAAADMFCKGWVIAVRRLVVPTSPSDDQVEAIGAYMRINHAQTMTMEPRSRAVTNASRASDHVHHGIVAGKNASLNRGVGGAPETALLG